MKWDDNCAVVQDSDVNASIEGRRLQSPQEVNQNLVGGTNSTGGFVEEEAVSVNSLFIICLRMLKDVPLKKNFIKVG